MSLDIGLCGKRVATKVCLSCCTWTVSVPGQGTEKLCVLEVTERTADICLKNTDLGRIGIFRNISINGYLIFRVFV